MSKTYEELKTEAKELGIDFKVTEGKAKLEAKIEAYYESQAADDSVSEVAEDVKQVEDEALKKSKTTTTKKAPANESPEAAFRRKSKERRDKWNNTTRKVTLMLADKRENDLLTTYPLNNGTVSAIADLGIPIELPLSLIELAKKLTYDLGVKDPKTGNAVMRTQKKFIIEYHD